MGETFTSDWTAGAAKWAAVAVLGVASLTGIVWSIARDRSAPPAVIVREPATLPVAAPAARDAPKKDAPPTSRAPAPLAAKIDLNSASRAEIELLPGVGPALAARIIEYRSAHGPFRSVDQLDAVKGIGPKLMEKIRPLVKVENSETK